MAEATLVMALSCAFRWKQMLEAGDHATVAELAERDGVAPSHMTRVLRLTSLGSETVEAMQDGRQKPEVTLARVLEPFALEWDLQSRFFWSATWTSKIAFRNQCGLANQPGELRSQRA